MHFLRTIRFALSVAAAFAAAASISAATPSAAPAPAASAELARPLAVGATAPAVTLQAADGTEFALGDAFARQPTILIFYRGSWCPFCNRQLAAVGQVEPQLLTLGYQIVAVSPDSAAGLKKMAGQNHLDYRLLSDRDMHASAAYGVAFRVPAETEKSYLDHGVDLAPVPQGEGHWLPVPAVFIVDRHGKIRFVHADPDYRVRLAAADLVAAAKAVAAQP